MHQKRLGMSFNIDTRSGSRAAATSKMEYFVIIVNGFQPLRYVDTLNAKVRRMIRTYQ